MPITSANTASSPSVGIASDAQVDAELRATEAAADGPLPSAYVTGVPEIGLRLTADVERWLDWQCRMISGVLRGAVFLMSKEQPGELRDVSFWPDEGGQTSLLRSVAAKAIQGKSGVVQKSLHDAESSAEVCDYLAFPLIHSEHVVGAVTMSLEIRSDAQRQAVMQLVQWGTSWLETVVVHGFSQSEEVESLIMAAIELLSADRPLPVVGYDLCSFLAEHLECSRVALGLSKGMHVQICAVSHQLTFDRRVAKLAQLEVAMEECIDQDHLLAMPLSCRESHLLTRAHQQLLEQGMAGAVCTVPLNAGGETIGALTLIRDREQEFDEEFLAKADEVASRIGAVVALKQRESGTLVNKVMVASRDALSRLFGAGHLRFKLMTASLVVIAALLGLAQTDMRVTARSTLAGASQQAIVAPFDGYLSAAHARAGDTVEADQVLAELDTRELLLEKDKWQSERDKHAKEYQEALAIRDRAKASIMSARMAQAEAQLNLVNDQITRTRLHAPFSGVLASGDLSRALGSPVQRGQLLFELVPQDSYRVDMLVDEHDVSSLEPGQRGTLRLTGFPDRPVALHVARVVPVATSEGGANYFRVEAVLQDLPAGVRPGMEGIAKIVTGRDNLFSAWTSELSARLRLWAWSIGLL